MEPSCQSRRSASSTSLYEIPEAGSPLLLFAYPQGETLGEEGAGRHVPASALKSWPETPRQG